MTDDERAVIHIMNDMCQVLEDVLGTLEIESTEVYEKVMTMYSFRIMTVTVQALGWAGQREQT